MVNWKHDLTLSVILFGLAAAFYCAGLEYPDTTAKFPSYLSIILAFLALLLGTSAMRRRTPNVQGIDWQAAKGPIAIATLTAGFILILPHFGFISSCFLLSFSIFTALGYPNKKIALLVAITATLAIYAVFHLALDVSLPVGSLWGED